LLERGVVTVIAGLETTGGPDTLSDLLRRVTPPRLVFSLDLKAGRPLTEQSAWRSHDPFEIAAEAIALGVERVLVLDLAQVGTGAGAGTGALCRQLRGTYPRLEITAGGGVHGIQDIATMRDAGADWLLIASALHDGRLDRDTVVAALS
jgi:phosphoribosylformimino-5-aminoimidazole carboxamide ribotide isomerase